MTPSARISRLLLWWQSIRISLRTESLVLLASLFFALACNGAFWKAAMAGYGLDTARGWLFFGAVLVILVAINVLLLSVPLTRWTAKPVLAFLVLATAFAVYFMQTFGVYLDPSMLRNALRTDFHEANELFTWGMIPFLFAYAVVPLALLSRVRLVPASWRSE